MIGLSRGGVAWDPWREFAQIRNEMNQLLSGGSRSRVQQADEFPTCCVWKGEDGLVLTCELPGVRPEELDVTAVRDAVTIRGVRRQADLPENAVFHRRERPTEQFARTVGLPYDINPQKTEASYERGILTLKLHRPDEHKPQRVAINAG